MTYDDEETLLIQRAKSDGIVLTDEHLQWRRMKIADITIAVFRQEYPSTPEEAIQGRRDLILPGMRECVIETLPFLARQLSPESLIGGIDFGYNDPTVILTGYYVDQAAYVVACYVASKAVAKDHAPQIVYGHTYFCDPSATGAREEIAAELRRTNVTAYLRPAPRRKGARQENFVNEEWEAVRTLMRDGRLFVLGDAAGQLVFEADNLSWNPKTGTPDMTRDLADEGWGHYDTLDALRYMVMGVAKRGSKQPARPRRAMSRGEAIRSW